MKFCSRPLPRAIGGIMVFAFAILLQITPLHGADRPLHYLTVEAVDPIGLLPAPPIMDSPEQRADMLAVVNARNTCSSNDLVIALEHDRSLTPYNMAPFIGDFFKADRLPKTAALFRHAESDTSRLVAVVKDHWQRPRPSVTDTNLLLTKPDLSYSYPSGHSAGATIVALILTELVPDKAEEILVASRNAGWHRVQLARHYPSDIQAGRVVALAAFRAMKANPRYQKEFAEAKAEMAAAFAAAAIPQLDNSKPKAAEAVTH